jgi:hypothetical protein
MAVGAYAVKEVACTHCSQKAGVGGTVQSSNLPFKGMSAGLTISNWAPSPKGPLLPNSPISSCNNGDLGDV